MSLLGPEDFEKLHGMCWTDAVHQKAQEVLAAVSKEAVPRVVACDEVWHRGIDDEISFAE
jgi:hypothetical protein